MRLALFVALIVFGLVPERSDAVTVIPLNDLGGRAGFHINGEASNHWFGLPVAGVGDFNGDGIDDFLVAAEHGGPASGGATYLIFGRSAPYPASLDLASLDGVSGMRIDSGISFGNELDASAAGDFNDDGYADLVIGTPDFNGLRGRACVVFGGPSHPAVLSLATIDGSNGTCYPGVSEFDNMGKAVAAVGDLNADGIDDIAIGSTLLNARAVDDGGIHVLFGRAGLFPAAQSLAVIDGSNGFTFAGQAAGDMLGISVAPAGDVNGDGRDDLVIGSESEQGRRGAAYVLFGRSTPWSAMLSPADIDGFVGIRLLGARNFDGLGRGVGGLDFDGDGFSDVVAGTTFGGIGTQNGSASVIYGHPAPFPAEIDVGTLDGTNGRGFYGSTSFERLGEQSAHAGDVNGDGFDDLMLTAPFADFGGADAGSMFIVFGSPQRGPAQLFSSAIPGRPGFRMDGFDTDGYCGQRQRRVGDINADGIDDLVVGCNYSSGGGTHRGSAHVIFGNAAPFARLPAAVATWIQSGGVPAIISIAAVAASHYVDRQPFAGAALTQTPSGAPGSWSFRQTATDAFQPLPADLGRNNALVLAASAQLAFLPEAGFVGTTALPLRFWDGSGDYSPGRFDIDAEIGSLGGFANDANVHSVIVSVGDTSFADGFE